MRSDEAAFHDWLDDLVEGHRGNLLDQTSPQFAKATSAATDLHQLAATAPSVAPN